MIRLMQYVEHDNNCRKLMCSATQGRPTKDGGYEQHIMGKWYQVRPVDKSPKIKCSCGLDNLLKELKQLRES